MMKAFIDSNLLVYLNTISDIKERIPYEEFYISTISKYKTYTDALVLDELIYISKKKYGIPYNLTLEFIDSIVKPYVAIVSIGEEEFEKAKEYITKYGLKPSNALHLGAMETNSISVLVSEDKEFEKVPEVRRLWSTY